MPNKTTIEIDGKNRGAVTAINGVKSELLSLGKVSGGVLGEISGAFGANLSVAGLTAAVSGLALLVKHSIDTADEMSKLSQKIGTSIEFLSTLKYAADLSDVSLDELSTGLGQLSKNLFDVKNNAGQTAKFGFDALGISAVDANGKLMQADQVILDIADRFSQMENGSKKTAVAMSLFGRSGKQLIPLLNAGSEGIREMQDEARKLGLEIDEHFAKRAETFNDNLTTLGYVGQGLGNTLATALMPAIINATTVIVDLVTKTDILPQVFSMASTWAKVFATSMISIYGAVTLVGESVGILNTYLDLMSSGQTAAAGIFWDVSTQALQKTFNGFKDTLIDTWSEGENWKELLKKIKAEQEDLTNSKAIEKLSDQWQGVSDKLHTEVLLMGLGPLVKEQVELNQKVQEMRDKYNSVPGALAEISNYYDQIIQKQLAISSNDINPKGIEQPNTPGQFDMQPIDTTNIDAYYQHRMDLSTSVTDAELANLALMQNDTQDIFGNLAGAMMNFYDATGQKSKEFFVMYKAMAIAQTAIATYQSAVEAYKSLVGIPIVGPALAAAAAAAAVTFGLSNIARIASMQPGSTGGGSAAGASSPSLPSSVNNSTTNNSSNVQYTIYVDGWVDNKDRFARELIESLEKARGDRLGS